MALGKNRRGQALVWVLGIAAALLVGIGAFTLLGGTASIGDTGDTTAEVDFEGEFDSIIDPDELSGNDLTVATEDLPDNGTVTDAALVASFDVNGTSGPYDFGVPFDVDGSNGFEEVDVKVDLDTDLNTSQLSLRNACIIPDVEGNVLDCNDQENVNVIDLTVEDEDSVDATIGQLDKGDYVLLTTWRDIDTSGIASGADLYTFELDGTSDGDDPDEIDGETNPVDNG